MRPDAGDPGLGGSAEPVAPPEMPSEDLLAACESYAHARRAQLGYRHHHDGGDDPALVDATLTAYNALIVASPLAKAALARAPQGDPPEFRRVLLPEPSSEAIQAALYAAQDTKSASDVEHVGVMLRAAYAVDGFPAPQGDAAPPNAIDTALNKLADAQLKLAVSARIVDVSERRWGGVAFNGDVYGVRPEDWQAVRDELNEVYDLLRGSASSSGSAPEYERSLHGHAAREQLASLLLEEVMSGEVWREITPASRTRLAHKLADALMARGVSVGGASSSGSAPPNPGDQP